MAEGKRGRLDSDIEAYLQSQSERILGKLGTQLTGAELTTLVNRVVYEHKLGSGLAKQIPLARVFNWLTGLVPGSNSKVVPLGQSSADAPALQASPESFDFDADLGDLYEDEAA